MSRGGLSYIEPGAKVWNRVLLCVGTVLAAWSWDPVREAWVAYEVVTRSGLEVWDRADLRLFA